MKRALSYGGLSMADKWIIGTGFTRGIGNELAKKLNEEGIKIIHLGRKKVGFENEFVWWDLLNPLLDNPIGDLHKILFGKNIYGFIHCAGAMPLIEVQDTNKTQKRLFWQSQAESMRINYLACAELIEEILPFLSSPYDEPIEKYTPFVAHLSSLAAIDPFEGLELYGATKAACLHYFNWLSKRFSSDKLCCLSIHPGVVQTDMTSDIINKERQNSFLVKMFKSLLDENKMLKPKDCAQKLYDYLFYEEELKTESHGRLFLLDKLKVYEGYKP